MKLKSIKPPRSYLSFRDFSLLLIPIVLISLLIGFYFFESSKSLTWKGIYFLKTQDIGSAVQNFSKALEENSENPYNHLNLGLAYDLYKNPVKSFQIYKFVNTQFKDSHADFSSYFNQAELHSRLGSIDKALENYQQALKFNIKQQEIKENIELLFKKNQSENKKQNQDEQQDQQQQQNQEQQQDQNQQQNQEQQQEGEQQQNQDEQQQQDQKDKPQEQNQQSKQDDQKSKKDLKLDEEKAIMKAIEKQETEVRKKAMKRKNEFGNKGGKDW